MDRKEKQTQKEMEKQKKLDDIFTGKTQIKPDDIHKYGLEFLRSNHFVIGQTIDIGYPVVYGKKSIDAPRIFALDSQKRRFYQDPFPISEEKYTYQIYEIDKIANPNVVVLEKEVERKIRNESIIVKQLIICVEFEMLDPNIPNQVIVCKPYGDVQASDDVYYFRAKQIKSILEVAMALTKTGDQTNDISDVPSEKPAICKGCGAPVPTEGETDACEFCGAPLQ